METLQLGMEKIELSEKGDRVDSGEGSLLLQVWWADVGGSQECVGLFLGSFESIAGGGITIDQPVRLHGSLRRVPTTVLRTIPVGELTRRYRGKKAAIRFFELTPNERRRVLKRLSQMGVAPDEVTLEDVTRAIPPDVAEKARARRNRSIPSPTPAPGRRGRPARPPLFFAQVAAVYAEAHEAGRNPALEVARKYVVQPSTARNWINSARHQHGMLTKTRPGQGGGKLTKKARALLSAPTPEEES